MTSRNFRRLSWVRQTNANSVMVVRGKCEWRAVRFHLLRFSPAKTTFHKFEREPEEYTVGQLKRWLKCRGLKLSGKRDELLKRVSDCIKSGNHHTHDPSIDDGKWFSAKVLKENAKLQANCSLSSLPFVPSTGWRAFPSQNTPSLFNYGHVHYYALESVQDINGAEEIEDGLGQI